MGRGLRSAITLQKRKRSTYKPISGHWFKTSVTELSLARGTRRDADGFVAVLDWGDEDPPIDMSCKRIVSSSRSTSA